MRILVVEDDPGCRSALALLLETEGYDVATAENGRAALEEIDRSPPHLVILDLWMPIMNGWQFLERLRDPSHPLSRVPVIVLTADQQAQVATLPVQAHLWKPVGLNELMRGIRKLTAPGVVPRAIPALTSTSGDCGPGPRAPDRHSA